MALLTILLGNGDRTFTPAPGSPITVGGGPYALATADFHSDGKLDLVVANQNDSTLSILLGNGDGTFTPLLVRPSLLAPYRCRSRWATSTVAVVSASPPLTQRGDRFFNVDQ